MKEAKEEFVLVADDVGHKLSGKLLGQELFCRPAKARSIHPRFRAILEKACEENVVVPAVLKATWFITHKVEELTRLQFIGVKEMSASEYTFCIHDPYWLLRISEELYWEVIAFVSLERGCCAKVEAMDVPLLKYVNQDGVTCLAPLPNCLTPTARRMIFISMSTSKETKWLAMWTSSALTKWVPLFFMPPQTAKSLEMFITECKVRGYSANEFRKWLKEIAMVGELSGKYYADEILKVLLHSDDAQFIILATNFLRRCVEEGQLDLGYVSGFARAIPVVDAKGVIRRLGNGTVVLLPARGSKWPVLNMNRQSSSGLVIVMSNDYMIGCMEECREFLIQLLGAYDLPMLPPPNAPLDLLATGMTPEQSVVLLEWLESCLPLRIAPPYPDLFLDALKVTPWLYTESHGLQIPGRCFLRSAFVDHFSFADLPFLDTCLNGNLNTLTTAFTYLGVNLEAKKSCGAVASHILRMSIDNMVPSDREQIFRLYRYLQKFAWRPAGDKDAFNRIFVPGCAEKETKGAWREIYSCVMYDTSNLLSDDGSIISLENLYPSDLHNFLIDVLKVPRTPPVEMYCTWWLSKGTSLENGSLTKDQCREVWMKIATDWRSCAPEIWHNFAVDAWVPSVVRGSLCTVQVIAAQLALIPDDSRLHQLFLTGEKCPSFVWYPELDGQSEGSLFEVYAALGAKRLSESVECKFHNIPASILGKRGRPSREGLLCPGLYRSILGFLAKHEYALKGSERREIIGPILEAVEVEMDEPFTKSFTMSSSPEVVSNEEPVLAHWLKGTRQFFVLKRSHPALQASLISVWEFHSQFATAVAEGILSRYPAAVSAMIDFLKLLVGIAFQRTAVDFELRQRNTYVHKEDEEFLVNYYRTH